VIKAARLAPSILLLATVLAGPAVAQTAGTPPKAKPPAAQAAASARALVSTSSVPTFDEGTVPRIAAAMLSYSAIENLNPTWTVPLSIMKKDIITKMRKDPGYVDRMHMRVLDGAGAEIDPRQVDWNSDRAPNFTIRQDSGNWNALGAVRIDMPNPYSVYMHDTSHKEFFSADYRFQSSGCTRVEHPRDLASAPTCGSRTRSRSPGSISPAGARATA
jgi:hypothetical protein